MVTFSSGGEVPENVEKLIDDLWSKSNKDFSELLSGEFVCLHDGGRRTEDGPQMDGS